MGTNVHSVERVLRVIAGLAILYVGLVSYNFAWWGWLGLIPILTGSSGFCPLYRMFGFKTGG